MPLKKHAIDLMYTTLYIGKLAPMQTLTWPASLWSPIRIRSPQNPCQPSPKSANWSANKPPSNRVINLAPLCTPSPNRTRFTLAHESPRLGPRTTRVARPRDGGERACGLRGCLEGSGPLFGSNRMPQALLLQKGLELPFEYT